MADIERAAVAAEGYHPDDRTVVAALARVSAVLGFHAGLDVVVLAELGARERAQLRFQRRGPTGALT
jgi:hypothetical protein